MDKTLNTQGNQGGTRHTWNQINNQHEGETRSQGEKTQTRQSRYVTIIQFMSFFYLNTSIIYDDVFTHANPENNLSPIVTSYMIAALFHANFKPERFVNKMYFVFIGKLVLM